MHVSAIFVVFLSVLLLFCEESLSERCLKRMSESEGEFTSPLYPFNYPSNSECMYVIKASADYYIEVTFTRFNLEYPYQGKKTDYIVIQDGGENNRQREMTVDGSQRKSFTYTSLTGRVIVRFFSNKLFNYEGFKATYKFVERAGCPPAQIDHGQSECNLKEPGLARYCEFTCDEKFTLEGKPKSYCQGGAYVNLPSCVPDPSTFCNITEVEDFNPECDKDPITEQPKNCNYTCEENFIPLNDGSFSCVDGSWVKPPECIADPDLVDICTDNQESEECPFTAEETEEHKKAYFDEMANLEEEKVLIIRCNGCKMFKCPRQLCWYQKGHGYVVKCNAYAKKIQKLYRISNEKRDLKKKVCHQCQAHDCVGPVPIFP